MGDLHRLPHCQKCGKEMKEIVYRKRVVIPSSVVLRTLRFWVHPVYFWYFRCPDKHTGAVLIPVMYRISKKTKKRKYFNIVK